MAPKAPGVEMQGACFPWIAPGARESIGVVEARHDATAATIDLVVIGGGITGCAIARDAVARGLSTVVVERSDLAAGTSGRSTKLLHGGLRYLEHGDLALVRQALREREVTARLAPGLAEPLRFVVPAWPGRSPGRIKARLGVALYDLLAFGQALPRGGSMSAHEIGSLAPGLAPGYRGGVAFSDRQTDDIRLTVAIAKDAVRRGATLRLGATVVALERSGPGHTVTCRADDGASFEMRARVVINATGAWADRVRQRAGRSAPLLRTSRGAHLVLAGLPLGAALLLAGERPGHRLFAIPWRGVTLFGTTDVDDAVPERDDPVADDLRLLFREARRLFPAAGLARGNVLSAFTGVRPLVRQDGETLRASREHAVHDEDGLITIVGGKLTTWRLMAIDAVDRAVARLGQDVRSPDVLLVEPLPPETRPVALDAVLEDEFPRHAGDVVFRRLPIGHDPREIRRVLPEVVLRMAERLGWDAQRSREEQASVLDRLDAASRRVDEALSG
jgi:glycerol-3-phosphate dehydrogenase